MFYFSFSPIFVFLYCFHYNAGQGVDFLYKQHSAYLIKQAIESYEVDSSFTTATNVDHIILHRLLQGPYGGVYSSSNPILSNQDVLLKLVEFLCSVSNLGKIGVY